MKECSSPADESTQLTKAWTKHVAPADESKHAVDESMDESM